LEAAIYWYQKCLVLAPKNREAIFRLGTAYEQKKDYQQAKACYHTLLSIEPVDATCLNNLGNVLDELGEICEAAACYRKAIRIRRRFAQAYYNLGVVRFRQNKLKSAVACYKRATEVKKDYFDAWHNMGIACKNRGRFQEAHEAFDSALSIRPEDVRPHLQKAFTCFLAGNYEKGWLEYEWRFRESEETTYSGIPRWDGSEIRDGTILVEGEQGLGDIIQFVRYLPMVASRCKHVVFACRKELTRLMLNTKGIGKLVEQGSDGYAGVTCDAYIPLLSLPLLFGVPQDVLRTVPYIHIAPKMGAVWKRHLDYEKCNVGIVWGSGPKYPDRDCPLEEMLPILETRGVAFYSLQKGPAAQQIERFLNDKEIYDCGHALYDFSDTAAIVSHLDLVISVDTSVAHVAGAMGKEVWTLLPAHACWRYGWRCKVSPWYPTMKLFRQQKPGDWKPVISSVSRALRAFTHLCRKA
jgi:tetratricopeptide (TPR) repeat protein